MPDIRSKVESYHQSMVDDANHRYMSWEHCYSHFRGHEAWRSVADFDLAALHLSFYLASWGMYRGSGFLLQKDYRVHVPIVRVLCHNDYRSLWKLNPVSASDKHVELIMALWSGLRDAYRSKIKKVDGKKREVDPSDILLTKIMLGTMGCVPAYDRSVIAGLGACRIRPKSFGRKSYRALLEFCRDNAADFRALKIRTRDGTLTYPIMKLLDMYLWQMGDKEGA
jgi:hypothetical protein